MLRCAVAASRGDHRVGHGAARTRRVVVRPVARNRSSEGDVEALGGAAGERAGGDAAGRGDRRASRGHRDARIADGAADRGNRDLRCDRDPARPAVIIGTTRAVRVLGIGRTRVLELLHGATATPRGFTGSRRSAGARCSRSAAGTCSTTGDAPSRRRRGASTTTSPSRCSTSSRST